MAFKLSAKTIGPVLKTAAKVTLPVGAGFLFGRVGAEVAKAVSAPVARFAAKGDAYEGIVRAFVGIPLGLALAFLLAKKNGKTFMKLAALSISGTLATAAQPVAQKHIESATATLKKMLSKNGAAAAALPAGTPATLQLAPKAAGLGNPRAELHYRAQSML